MKLVHSFFLCAALSFIESASAQIYADFHTSAGNFTCELNYVAAPKTVANFIGLAEGSRAWVDANNGAVRMNTPFYNGVSFHRVIADFMSQSGSKRGDGSDSPGYEFLDETTNGLTHLSHVLSMANSGKNTNGSQFFITNAPAHHLDGVHTVFGTVTSGSDVVDAINHAQTVFNPASGAFDKPLDPVMIQSVEIRRVGSAALAFNIDVQGLPVVTSLAGTLEVIPAEKVDLHFTTPRQTGTTLAIQRSPDLVNWGASRNQFYLAPGSNVQEHVTIDQKDPLVTTSELLPRAFYQKALVTYSDALGPDQYQNRTLTCSGNHTFTFTFNADGQSGLFTSTMVSNSQITKVEFYPGPYKARWIIYTVDWVPFLVTADTNSVTSTAYTGIQTFHAWTSGSWSSVDSGSFTLTK